MHHYQLLIAVEEQVHEYISLTEFICGSLISSVSRIILIDDP